MAKMTRNARFQRGSGCFPCGVCGRQTRNTGDNGSVELCPQCYDLAGIENALSDSPKSWPENPSEETSAVWAKYEGEINENLNKLRGFGIDVETVWSNLLRYRPEALVTSSGEVLPVVETPEEKAEYAAVVAALPSKKVLAADLEAEVAMRREEYRLLLSRLVAETTAAAGDFDRRGKVSDHDGANLGRTAADLQALASRILLLENLVNFAS